MALPSILKTMPRRRHVQNNSTSTSEFKFSRQNTFASKQDLKRNTRSRRIFGFAAAFSYLVSFIFLLLILLGNTNGNSVLGEIYFFRLDLANIIPTNVANAQLINSIARSFGLHDFYQAGLWSYCEGYNDEGITFCSTPVRFYWFNPVEILMNELLAGATIAIPSEIMEILGILQTTSNIMFGFFLASIVLVFVLIFASPLPILSRWWSMPISILSFVTLIMVLVATIIASVISFVFKYAATAQSALNISAYVGGRMFVFMWISTGFALMGFIIHSGMGCCCTSRRDIKIGRKPMRYVSVREKTADTTTTTAGICGNKTPQRSASQTTTTGVHRSASQTTHSAPGTRPTTSVRSGSSASSTTAVGTVVGQQRAHP